MIGKSIPYMVVLTDAAARQLSQDEFFSKLFFGKNRLSCNKITWGPFLELQVQAHGLRTDRGVPAVTVYVPYDGVLYVLEGRQEKNVGIVGSEGSTGHNRKGRAK